jgi:hypothetical protein
MCTKNFAPINGFLFVTQSKEPKELDFSFAGLTRIYQIYLCVIMLLRCGYKVVVRLIVSGSKSNSTVIGAGTPNGLSVSGPRACLQDHSVLSVCFVPLGSIEICYYILQQRSPIAFWLRHILSTRRDGRPNLHRQLQDGNPDSFASEERPRTWPR